MALIKCPECGSEISDKSEVCIKCGCPLRKNVVEDDCSNESSMVKPTIIIISILVALVTTCVVLYFIINNDTADTVPVNSNPNIVIEQMTEEPTLSWKEEWVNKHIELAVDEVKKDLLNRDSLQLRKVVCQIYIYDDNGNEIPNDKKTIRIMVDYSAENKFGGHTLVKCVVVFEDSVPSVRYEDDGFDWLIYMLEEQEYTETYEYFEYDGEEVELMLEQQNQ